MSFTLCKYVHNITWWLTAPTCVQYHVNVNFTHTRQETQGKNIKRHVGFVTVLILKFTTGPSSQECEHYSKLVLIYGTFPPCSCTHVTIPPASLFFPFFIAPFIIFSFSLSLLYQERNYPAPLGDFIIMVEHNTCVLPVVTLWQKIIIMAVVITISLNSQPASTFHHACACFYCSLRQSPSIWRFRIKWHHKKDTVAICLLHPFWERLLNFSR